MTLCSSDAAVSCSTSQAGPYTSVQCREFLSARTVLADWCGCMQRLSVRPSAQLRVTSPRSSPPWCEPSLSRPHSGLILSFFCGAAVARAQYRVLFPHRSHSFSSPSARVTVKVGPLHPRSTPPIADRTFFNIRQRAWVGLDLWIHTAVGLSVTENVRHETFQMLILHKAFLNGYICFR